VIFCSNIIKTPESSRDGAYIKRRGKEKEKLQEYLQIKGKSIFREEKNTSTLKSFLMSFHFLPLHHAISETLSKFMEKVFLTLFGLSFSLAIYMT
jgi:hypothetical protein